MSPRHVMRAALGLLALAVVPAPAQAAVERVGNTFKPKNGAELLEAVDQLGSQGSPSTIELAADEYLIDRPLVLDGRGVRWIVTALGGETVVANAGAPGPLLIATSSYVLSSEQNEGSLLFEVRGSTDAAFAAVAGLRDSTFNDIEVVVPAGAPNVTGLQMGTGSAADYSSYGQNVNGVHIASEATRAPAVRATTPTTIEDSVMEGGSAVLEVDGAAAPADAPVSGSSYRAVSVRTSLLAATDDTRTVVRSVASRSLAPRIASSLLSGGASTDVIVDVDASVAAAWQGAGQRAASLVQNTLSGPPSSTVVRVRGSAAGQALVAVGLLSEGSSRLIDCAAGPAGAQLTVTNRAFWAEGGSVSGPGCTLNESERASGALTFEQDADGFSVPRWDSAIVGRISSFSQIPEADRASNDILGRPRSWGNGRADIGAVAYPGQAPEVRIGAGPVHNAATASIRLIPNVSDGNATEVPLLRYRWVVNGVEHFGPELTLPQGEGSWTVRLEVTDPTGLTASTEMTFTQSSGGAGYGDSPPSPPSNYLLRTPRPTPTPAPTPRAPRPSPTPTPEPAAVLSSVAVPSKYVRFSAKRQSGVGRARRGEAQLLVSMRLKRAITMTVQVKRGGKYRSLGGATRKFSLPAGESRVRISRRIGKRVLKPGLYRVRLQAKGIRGRETQTAFIRVRR